MSQITFTEYVFLLRKYVILFSFTYGNIFYWINGSTWAAVKGQTISKCMTQVETALCSANQLGTKYPSVPTVTSWYLHALWIYLGGRGRQGRARKQRLRLRSLDKLAKPLRWFQLKLAVLPVGSINSELPQTLTSMGELLPPWPPSMSPLSLVFSITVFSPFPSYFTTESSNYDSLTTLHNHYSTQQDIIASVSFLFLKKT